MTHLPPKNLLKTLWWANRPYVGWQSTLTKTCTPDEIDKMDSWENQYQDILKTHEIQYLQEEPEKVKEQILEFEKEFDEDWKKERQLEFLDNNIQKEEEKVAEIYQNNFEWAKADIPHWFRSILLEDLPLKNLKKHTMTKRFLVEGRKDDGKITQEETARANSFPLDQLIEVNRAMMAKCPFHEDDTASFYIKNNFGYCFGCNWTGDVIKFVMDRDKTDFRKVVKSLVI
jgi:hypothetical protein